MNMSALLLSMLVQAAGSTALPLEKETLPNGMRVVYQPDSAVPLVATVVWYEAGARHDPPGRSGLAHLVEHLLLADEQHRALMTAAGARPGRDMNASTDSDYVNYFQQIAPPYLEQALWSEARRLRVGSAAITQALLDREREVVKNERQGLVDARPYGSWDQELRSMLFPADHPYHRHPVGTVTGLDAITLDDVREFMDQHYRPETAVLVITGNFDIAIARNMVHRYFGSIPRRGAGLHEAPVLAEHTVPQPAADARVRYVFSDIPVPAVYLGFLVPGTHSHEAEALMLLSSAAAWRTSSPLHQELVVRRRLASGVTGYPLTMHVDGNILFFSATGVHDVDADSLRYALADAIQQLAATIDESMLEEAKADMRFRLADGLQWIGGFGGRGDQLAGEMRFRDSPERVATREERYDGVTLEQFRMIAERWLSAPAAVVYVRDTPPYPQTAADGRWVLELDSARTDAGTRLIHVPRPHVPIVAARLLLPAGSLAEPDSLRGIAELARRTVAARANAQLSPLFGRVAARSISEVTATHTSIDLNATADAFAVAWPRLLETWLQDTVYADAFEQAQRQLIGRRPTQYERILTAMRQLAFGANHPAAGPTYGDSAAIARIRLQDVQDWIARHYHIGEATILSAGQLPSATLAHATTPIAPRRGPVVEPVGHRPREGVGPSVVILDLPNAPQATIHVAQAVEVGDGRAVDVWTEAVQHALEVELRERRGWVYAVRKIVEQNPIGGMIGLGFDVDAAHADSAAKVAVALYESLRAQGIEADDLRLAARSLAMRMPAELQLVRDVVARLTAAESSGDGAAALVHYRLGLSAVTADDIGAVATGPIGREHPVHLVVLGDAERLRPLLAAAFPDRQVTVVY